jgi:hypothetical protein
MPAITASAVTSYVSYGLPPRYLRLAPDLDLSALCQEPDQRARVEHRRPARRAGYRWEATRALAESSAVPGILALAGVGSVVNLVVHSRR